LAKSHQPLRAGIGLLAFRTELRELRNGFRRFAIDLGETSAADFPSFIASRGTAGRFSAVHRFPGRRWTIFRRSSPSRSCASDFAALIAFRAARERFPAGDHVSGTSTVSFYR
jgi:hypothetical protein